MKDLNGVAVIVTGGGSGLGAATARMLVNAGCEVAIWDMNINLTDSSKYLVIECDVASEQSAIDALAETTEKLGAPRILINCAGILRGERLVGREGPASLDNFAQVINVNLIGTFNVMRLVAAAMAKLDPVTSAGERGVIINTASISAFEGQLGQVAYSASKAGVVGMVLPAARELAQFGIRVMAIAPGAVATPMIGAISQEIQDSITASIPFPKRMAKPEEFAELVKHIISNEMLNGEVIRLDGAVRLTSKPNERK